MRRDTPPTPLEGTKQKKGKPKAKKDKFTATKNNALLTRVKKRSK